MKAILRFFVVAPVYKLFILYIDVLYHNYLLVFIDLFFVPMQSLLHYRLIFLYQKVFHTFMCSIKCTTVQYHGIEIDNQSALLLSSLSWRGKGLLIRCQTVGW